MKIIKVWFDDKNIFISLNSGHIIGNPLLWYPRLYNSTKAQREAYALNRSETAIRWEEIDEDLSLDGFIDFDNKMLFSNEKINSY